MNKFFQVDEESINLLDEHIDTDTQLEYFECSQNHQNGLSDAEIIRRKDLIFGESISQEEKKVLLVQLAAINDIVAYRTIERYLKEPDLKLYDWAFLALLENRMLIESSLLDENKVLITTGLGGKGSKFRYFIVFFTADGSDISELQKKIIINELDYAAKKNDAEIESVNFQECFAAITTIVPMQVSVPDLFKKIVLECNEFGGFLFNDYIITNVKVLSLEEIKELLAINNIL